MSKKTFIAYSIYIPFHIERDTSIILLDKVWFSYTLLYTSLLLKLINIVKLFSLFHSIANFLGFSIVVSIFRYSNLLAGYIRSEEKR